MGQRDVFIQLRRVCASDNDADAGSVPIFRNIIGWCGLKEFSAPTSLQFATFIDYS